MQTVFFLVTLVVLVSTTWALAGGVEMPWRMRQRLAPVPVLALLVNVPWLIVCRLMRRRLVRRIGWSERGLCAWCGYDVSGLPRESACPECGRTFAASQEALRRSASRW